MIWGPVNSGASIFILKIKSIFMAETKIVSIEAIQNIQQLKDNIKELKAEVNTLTVGSEEYNQKVLALAENQRALKLAMTGVYDSMREVAQASRQDTEAINATVQAAEKGTATYNQMSTALGALKAQIKDIPKYLSEQDQALNQINPAYTELNNKIQTLDSTLKKLDADNGVFGRNVGNYLGALQEWGGAMGQVNQVGNQLMTGVVALLGVMNLFGADTEDTKDALQSLVPVLAVLNAGKGIGGLVKLLPKAATSTVALAAATTADAAANTANATAAGAATVATEAQTVAQEGLNKSMLANPILAVIAGLTALIGVVAKYVSNANKAAKATKELKEQQTALNEKFTKQNEELERDQKLKAAQGVSNQVLLAQKKQQIVVQKQETEALLTNIKARIAQMKSDSAWVRFWKGENKQIKNLEAQMKELNEQIKGFDNQIANLDVDIQVDAINKGKDAAKKYADTLKNDIKSAVNVANAAIKSQKTELESLSDEYNSNAKILESGITAATAAMKKFKVGSKDWKQAQEDLKTIQSGVTANQERYNKALAEYNSKKYGAQIIKDSKELSFSLNKATSKQQELERLLDTVLGFSTAQAIAFKAIKNNGDIVLEASTSTKVLAKSYEELGNIIERDILKMTGFEGALPDLTVSGLNWDTLVSLSQTDAERLIANVGEPLATAIGEWVKNSKELKEVSYKGLEEAFAQGKTLFDDAINSGDINLATSLRDKLVELLKNSLGNDPEISAAIQQFILFLNSSIDEVLANDEYSLNFGEKYRALIATSFSGMSTGFEAEFNSILKITDDFNNTFVASTAEALAAVADLWETSIKWKYKKLVESGKMTEEQAEEQARAEFENVKALQIGLAAINTAAAVVSALADPTVPSYYVKIANAIAAGVAGAAQIMTISMTEFGKPSVNTSSSVSTPTYTNEPEPMYYSYGINPMDYAEANAQAPVKVYVTDQDIVDGIDNYNNRKAEVTF